MIKVVEEKDAKTFEEKVNELLKDEWHISNTMCGQKYAAILTRKSK